SADRGASLADVDDSLSTYDPVREDVAVGALVLSLLRPPRAGGPVRGGDYARRGRLPFLGEVSRGALLRAARRGAAPTARRGAGARKRPAVIDELLEGDARHVLHRQVRRVALLVGLVHLHDRGVAQPRRRDRLAAEARQHVGAGQPLLADDLQRDDAAVVALPG